MDAYDDELTAISSSVSPKASRATETMQWWVQFLWYMVFTVMVAVAVGGNSIVIWIVVAHRKMRTVTNYLLVNLSVADLLLSSLNCFFNFIYMLRGYWQFGKWYCTVNNFIGYATVAASVFTLTAISYDRYFAIVHPLRPRMSKVSSLLAICLIWIASMLTASPCLLYSATITYRYGNKERDACILLWPDGQPTESQMDFIYQVVFLVVTYIIPITLMIGCYSAVGRILWGARSIGELNQRQVESIKSKRKVVRMFIMILLVFAICWLPYHAYFIYTHFDKKIVYKQFVQHLYLGFYWFAMSNAMVNPLVYYWMNARFRRYFKTALGGWICIYKQSNVYKFDESKRRNTHSYSKSAVGLQVRNIQNVHADVEEMPLTKTGKSPECVQRQTTTSTLLTSKSSSGKQRWKQLNCDRCNATTVNL